MLTEKEQKKLFQELPVKNQEAKTQLLELYRKQFRQWFLQLRFFVEMLLQM